MRCDKCHQNDATIFLTQVLEGDTTNVALCATCGEPFTQGAILPHDLLGLLDGAGSQRSSFRDPFSEVANEDPRYAREAFFFVRDGVDRAVTSLSRSSRHVTAKELLDALRSLALERYDLTARKQLRSWGLTCCEDFGEIVFTLIEHGIFGSRPEDKKEDFSNGYDFTSAFPDATPQV
jgi:uncharacterized repeat protein (TIGR04138 family)